MKTIIPSNNNLVAALLLFFSLLLCSAICQAQAPAAAATNQLDSTNYICVQAGPYSKIWQKSLLSTNTSGDVTTNEQSYEELGTGISYLSNGQYVDAVEEVESAPGGAQAIQGRHQVQWALNANTPGGAVTVNTSDGKQLVSAVFGLAYFDTASGSNAPIGQLKDCNGSIVAPNQVLYADAFSNITADVLYTYTKAGLSQNIVLRQAPPPPSSYGLSDASTILQIYTAFFTPLQPQITAVTNGKAVDDQVLDFGDMKMGPGQAFFLNGQNEPITEGIVQKQWVHVNNATYLVESIHYESISNQIQQLPHASNLKPGRGALRRLAFLDPLRTGPALPTTAARPMKLVRLQTASPRLVMDYALLSSSTNLTLQGDTTYLLTSLVNITGTAFLEGGTGVKYTNGGTAQLTATNIVCLTGPYSPGVFTRMNDNTVGSVITGSTGAPAQSAISYLDFGSLGTNSLLLRNLRFSYANDAIFGSITSLGANSIEIWDCQFVNCADALWASSVSYTGSGGFPIALYNVLLTGCGNGVGSDNSGSSYLSISAINVTADHAATFQTGTSNACSATNSLFTSVTNLSGVSLASCYTNSGSAGIYQIVGAGGYYLAAGSPYRDAGTASIPAALLADLQTATTYPPVVIPAGWFTNDYTFFPQAQRDTDTLDLGYHYCPFDYAIAIALSNVTVTVLPGTALAAYGTTYDYGVYLYTNGVFNCAGTATNPNYLVQYNTVQEQSNNNWTNGITTFFTPDLLDNSSANFAFTDWSALSDAQEIAGGGAACPFALQNCQFYTGNLTGNGPVIIATNCLFQRANFTVTDRTTGNSSQTFYNNLFWEGELSVTHHNTGSYTFRDNLFIQTSNTLTGSINYCSNNAYVTTNFGVLSPTNSDVFLTNSPAFETGALGQYYYPATQTNLIHEGSQSAPAAGLYHYTVTTNNIIEGANIVSIGFHYVAVGSNGLPLDTNGDGTPDYLEDAIGNGLVNSGEIDWQAAGDMGLTVIITQPVNNSTIP